ncbi:S-layer homology domain-containing protein [[Phormidium] sp. ETS-05]|uniref:S-layer homology domain-containing protein n=1 Tax=[Phormidium] sp. ETS-05 TaxID=222819 RepID=UPI0018EF0AE6|nr:S-layer homology domain-containing protein [[Phormidium] sp. ETS-05]
MNTHPMRVSSVALLTLLLVGTTPRGCLLAASAHGLTAGAIHQLAVNPPSPHSSPSGERLLAQNGANITLTDIQAHWAVDFIAALVERDIMRGFPDGTFRPDARVNRAEFAAVIERAFANRLSQTGRRPVPEFSDLPPNHWAYSAVKTAYALGFLGSYADNTFRPDQQITRVQIIVSLVKGLNLQGSNNNQSLATAFDDVGTIPDYARESIIAALENRLLFSDPNIRQLYPNQIATRADVAALVYRSLAISGLLPDRPPVASAIATASISGDTPKTHNPRTASGIYG